jgi:aryl carrier-like protein
MFLRALPDVQVKTMHGDLIDMAEISRREDARLMVRNAWEAVLQSKVFSEDDNFFVHGGDSMSGTMLMLALIEKSGQAFTLGDLYDCPTLGSLSELVARRLRAPA